VTNEVVHSQGADGIPGDDGVEIARFKRVRADLASVEQCLRENILRADHVVDEPKAAGDEAQDDVEDGVETYALLDKPPSGGQLVFIESGIGTAPGTSAPKAKGASTEGQGQTSSPKYVPKWHPPKGQITALCAPRKVQRP
jgi:hypothetical protein